MGILHQPHGRSLLSIIILSTCFLGFSQYALSTSLLRIGDRNLQEPIASPTPPPSPSVSELKPKPPTKFRKVLHFLSCNRDKWLKGQELFKTGPQLPDSYNPNSFSFPALVQGVWPAVIVYELAPRSSLIIKIEAKDVQPFAQKLAGTGQRQEIMFDLPARFGRKPQAALISIKAFSDDPREKKPADIRLYALGMGDEAVGSVPVVVKHPGRINTVKGEKFNYEFRSSKYFNAVRSDFWLSKISKGKHRSKLVNSTEFGTLQENTWKPGEWNGRLNSVGKFSIGPHQLNLNARTSKAPWLLVWTDVILID